MSTYRVLNVKALVGAFSVFVKSSRTFVWSSNYFTTTTPATMLRKAAVWIRWWDGGMTHDGSRHDLISWSQRREHHHCHRTHNARHHATLDYYSPTKYFWTEKFSLLNEKYPVRSAVDVPCSPHVLGCNCVCVTNVGFMQPPCSHTPHPYPYTTNTLE